jgi:hypothetical protein
MDAEDSPDDVALLALALVATRPEGNPRDPEQLGSSAASQTAAATDGVVVVSLTGDIDISKADES